MGLHITQGMQAPSSSIRHILYQLIHTCALLVLVYKVTLEILHSLRVIAQVRTCSWLKEVELGPHQVQTTAFLEFAHMGQVPMFSPMVQGEHVVYRIALEEEEGQVLVGVQGIMSNHFWG